MIEEVLNVVADTVEALGLTLDASPLPVTRARQPRQEEGTTPDAQITVSAAPVRPHETKRFNNQNDLHTVKLRVALWTPGNLDASASGGTASAPTATHSAWETEIQAALDRRSTELAALIPGLRDMRASAAYYLDRSAFLKGWDTQSVEVTASIVKERART